MGNQRYYSVKETAEILGISADSLRMKSILIEKQDGHVFKRNKRNFRLYSEDDLTLLGANKIDEKIVQVDISKIYNDIEQQRKIRNDAEQEIKRLEALLKVVDSYTVKLDKNDEKE